MISAHCSLCLPDSSNSPTSASSIAETISMHHHTQLIFVCRYGVSLCFPGWFWTPKFKWSSCLGLPKCWNYRCEPLHPASTLNISSHSILACKVYAETYSDSLMGISFYVKSHIYLAVFKITSLSLCFDNLIIMCLDVELFRFNLFGEFGPHKSGCESSPDLEFFSVIISLNKLLCLFLFSFWRCCNAHIGFLDVVPQVSQAFFILFHSFFCSFG